MDRSKNFEMGAKQFGKDLANYLKDETVFQAKEQLDFFKNSFGKKAIYKQKE